MAIHVTVKMMMFETEINPGDLYKYVNDDVANDDVDNDGYLDNDVVDDINFADVDDDDDYVDDGDLYETSIHGMPSSLSPS